MTTTQLILCDQSGLALHHINAMRFEVHYDRQTVGLAGFEKFEGGRIELYYTITPQHRRQGYATTSALLLCRWAFQELRLSHVSALANSDNRASRKVLEKCGFKLLTQVGPILLRYELRRADFKAALP